MKRTIERLRAEFLEMPGLQLTVDQVERLCGIERTRCKAVLEALVDTKFLCVKPNGAYGRVTDGDPGASPARDDLEVREIASNS